MGTVQRSSTSLLKSILFTQVKSASCTTKIIIVHSGATHQTAQGTNKTSKVWFAYRTTPPVFAISTKHAGQMTVQSLTQKLKVCSVIIALQMANALSGSHASMMDAQKSTLMQLKVQCASSTKITNASTGSFASSMAAQTFMKKSLVKYV